VTSRSRRALAVSAALLWTAAAAGVGLSSAPAAAATGRCSGGHGVTVVVDFGPLGGGTRIACDADGAGETAKTVMEHAGFSLDWVRTDPGFVCAIESRPDPDSSCQRVPPADAYWALFWSDGRSGWKYSSAGAGSLKLQDGGSVGWRFQDGGARDNPSQTPTSSTSSSSPTPTPTPTPSPTPHHPGGAGNGDGGNGPDDGSAGKSSPTPDDPASASPPPKSEHHKGRDQVAVVGAGGASGAGQSGGNDQGDSQHEGKGGKNGKGDRGGNGHDGEADSPSPSADDEASPDTGETTVGSADVLEDTAAKPGPGDGVLTAVATTSVVLLGAAAGVVGWRRRS
jgi:hypothetical protein